MESNKKALHQEPNEKGLHHLFVDQLKDLYNAENQLVKALPKMAKQTLKEEEQTEKDLTTLSNELLANAGK